MALQIQWRKNSVLEPQIGFSDSSRTICKTHAEPGVANVNIVQGWAGSGQEWSRSEMLLCGGTLAGNRCCSPPGPCDGTAPRCLGRMEGNPWEVKKTAWYPGHTWEHDFLPGLKEKALKMSDHTEAPPRGCDLGQRDSANLLRLSEPTGGLGSMHPSFTPPPLPSPVSFWPRPT